MLFTLAELQSGVLSGAYSHLGGGRGEADTQWWTEGEEKGPSPKYLLYTRYFSKCNSFK